jgi:hypothetical protein
MVSRVTGPCFRCAVSGRTSRPPTARQFAIRIGATIKVPVPMVGVDVPDLPLRLAVLHVLFQEQIVDLEGRSDHAEPRDGVGPNLTELPQRHGDPSRFGVPARPFLLLVAVFDAPLHVLGIDMMSSKDGRTISLYRSRAGYASGS